MKFMNHLISLEDWQKLQGGVQTVKRRFDVVNKHFEMGSVPTLSVLQPYFESFDGFLEIVEEIRERCAEIGVILEHDFSNNLTTCFLVNANVKKNYPKGLDKLKAAAAVIETIRDVIESVRFYVDGQLEAESVPIMKFLIRNKDSIQRAFSGPKKTENNVVIYSLYGRSKVSINSGTVANLLQNIARNARGRGNAKHLLIYDKRIRNKEGKSFVKLSIEDDGVGIDSLPGFENEKGVVEDIFVRGQSRCGGKGLGLADAKERMKVMGGDIVCYGHGGIFNPEIKNRGVKFELFLPVAQKVKDKP